MKSCFVWCLVLLPAVIDGQLPDAVDESGARINAELKSTWGRGSVGHWPQPRILKMRDPDYTVRLLRPTSKKGRVLEEPLPTDECGIQQGRRIFNGKEAALAQFPWLAVLYYKWEFICGGSLISSQFVLTAAHCLPRTSHHRALKTFRVVLGDHDLMRNPEFDEDNDCFAREIMGVRKIIIHEKYKRGFYGNDIGLLKLYERVIFKVHIVPICLPYSDGLTEVNHSDSFIIAGWGRTENGTLSTVKRFADVEPVATDQCKKTHKGVNAATHICVGGGVDGKDSCDGDSGGPLMAVGDVRGSARYIAAGVLSTGAKYCGTPGMPSLYEKVSSHMTWILHNMTL